MKLKITLIGLLTLFSFYALQAQCSDAQFEEQNGIAVVETESGNLATGWNRETAASPFTGSSYIAWRGSNYFNSPGNGVINYTVKINNPGTYRFIWRSKVGIGSDPTEHNDSWLKIEANNFFAQRGTSIKYPIGSGKTPEVNGSGGGGWFKVFLASTTSWTWTTLTSDFDGHSIYATFNSAGVYTVRISGRSNGHLIDRFVMFKESQYSIDQAKNLSLAQTNCGTGTPPPPPPPPPPGENNPPTVSITNPANGANFDTGSNVAVTLNSSDPDGDITKHEIFVNGNKVDTDGASYSPHTIQNIQEGSYTILAKVTDASGATAESSVSITVGNGGSTPPPPPPPSDGNNPPTVSITSPNDGQNFSAGSTVTVSVSANDSDGTVTKHQVFVNNNLVDTDGINFTPHYIPNISEGSYAIKVTVTDNAGATASTTVNITVGSGGSTPPPPPPPSDGNNAPTVSITSPNDGQNFNTGSTVKVDVSADDTDGSVTKYQIYVNNTLVDTDGSNFTPHYISNIANGNYVIRATVTDDKGATASATVNISVGSDNPPPPPPPPPSDSDISLTLVNASTDFNIGPLTNGTNVSSGSNINVRADVANSNVKSVYFKLSGATSRNQTENVSPYALFGDISGNYASGTFNGGSHTLTVEAYSGLNRSGTLLETLVVSFTVASDGKTVIAYPNPVKEGDVTIKLPEEINGDAGYAIISPSGTEVERGIINTNSLIDGKTLQIDSSTMKNDGVYYLVIQANYDVFTVPIIKQ